MARSTKTTVSASTVTVSAEMKAAWLALQNAKLAESQAKVSCNTQAVAFAKMLVDVVGKEPTAEAINAVFGILMPSLKPTAVERQAKSRAIRSAEKDFAMVLPESMKKARASKQSGAAKRTANADDAKKAAQSANVELVDASMDKDPILAAFLVRCVAAYNNGSATVAVPKKA